MPVYAGYMLVTGVLIPMMNQPPADDDGKGRRKEKGKRAVAAQR